MDDAIFFLFEIAFISIISLGLLRWRSHYGLVPFYMFIAGCLIYGELTTNLALFTIFDYSVAGTAITIYPLILLVLIWVYDLFGIEEARRYVYGIIFTILLIIPLNYFFLAKSKYILSPYSPKSFELLEELVQPNQMILLFSLLGFIASFYLLMVLYDFLKSFLKNNFLTVFVAMTLTLYVGSIIFVGGLYIVGLATPKIFTAHLVGKTFASSIFSSIYFITRPILYLKKDREIMKTDNSIELDEKIEFGGKDIHKLRVLVADDSPDVLELLQHTIAYENWEVKEAKNGKEALGMVFASNPDIILLDIMMPEMDGYKVLEILKTHRTTKDIPVILITAKSETEEKIMGMGLGIADYITKPFLPEELVARIKMVMGRSQIDNRLKI